MIEDDLMLEIRRVKEEIAERFNYDVFALSAELKRLDAVGDWPVVNLHSRRESNGAILNEKSPAITSD